MKDSYDTSKLIVFNALQYDQFRLRNDYEYNLSREEIFEDIHLLYDLSSGMYHPDGEIRINHRIRLNFQK